MTLKEIKRQLEAAQAEYEANKAMRLGLEEPKRTRYRKLMEE